MNPEGILNNQNFNAIGPNCIEIGPKSGKTWRFSAIFEGKDGTFHCRGCQSCLRDSFIYLKDISNYLKGRKNYLKDILSHSLEHLTIAMESALTGKAVRVKTFRQKLLLKQKNRTN